MPHLARLGYESGTGYGVRGTGYEVRGINSRLPVFLCHVALDLLLLPLFNKNRHACTDGEVDSVEAKNRSNESKN